MSDTTTEGRKSFAEAFADARQSHNDRSRLFGPKAQSVETPKDEAELPAIDSDHVASTIAENLALKAQVAAAEEDRLDEIAYSDYETRADYANAADALFAAGGGDRMSGLIEDWARIDKEGAAEWISSREYLANQAVLASDVVETQRATQSLMDAYRDEKEKFFARHPEAQSGVLRDMVEASYEAPSEATPQAYGAALERSFQAAEGVANAYNGEIKVSQFRDGFTKEMSRHSAMRRKGPMESPPPPTEEELAKGITERLPNAGRAERVQSFRDQFNELSRPKFGEAMRDLQIKQAKREKADTRTSKEIMAEQRRQRGLADR